MEGSWARRPSPAAFLDRLLATPHFRVGVDKLDLPNRVVVRPERGNHWSLGSEGESMTRSALFRREPVS